MRTPAADLTRPRGVPRLTLARPGVAPVFLLVAGGKVDRRGDEFCDNLTDSEQTGDHGTRRLRPEARLSPLPVRCVIRHRRAGLTGAARANSTDPQAGGILSGMDAIEVCARCGREIDGPQAGGSEWAAIRLASGKAGALCAGCDADADNQAMDEDDLAASMALEEAGLGDDVDPGAMDDIEYEMREQLAIMFYAQSEPKTGA